MARAAKEDVEDGRVDLDGRGGPLRSGILFVASFELLGSRLEVIGCLFDEIIFFGCKARAVVARGREAGRVRGGGSRSLGPDVAFAIFSV